MFIKPLSNEILERMRRHFNRLYGPARAAQCIQRLAALTGRYGVGYGPLKARPLWDEKTAVLITYADTIQCEDELPLVTLTQFAKTHFDGVFSAIHLLPFFPWSSDDGFSVTDYRQVDPAYGNWQHIRDLGREFDLMFDLVLNHISRKSDWFKNYITGIAPYRDYFIEIDPGTDLSAVVRPRSLPLLTTARRDGTEKQLWTTFSEDQMDLNFGNPDVLFEFLDILLFYISTGAKIIRLDAIAYLWKQPGTACIHLEQTHVIVRLMRDLLDMIAPGIILLTETNVPHEENISYLGQGDEAHMVYQFSLPPLLLHALTTDNATFLTDWAKTASDCPAGCTTLNFTASHDGIGVRPLAGLIPDGEFDALIKKIKKLGGHISSKRNADGTESPYELNITYFDALGGDDLQTDRFLCSQTVMLALKGVPGVYFHSLTATPNHSDGVKATGRVRSINRKKWNIEDLRKTLGGRGPAARIFNEYRRRIKIRAQHAAFHPDGAQRVIDLGNDLFVFIRTAPGGAEPVTCISNFSKDRKKVQLEGRIPELSSTAPCIDLLSGTRFSGAGKQITLDPCQTVWLTS